MSVAKELFQHELPLRAQTQLLEIFDDLTATAEAGHSQGLTQDLSDSPHALVLTHQDASGVLRVNE